MRIFFLALFAVCCGLVGIKLKDHYKKRKEFYRDIVRFLKKVREEINFKKTYVEDAINRCDSEELAKLIKGESKDCPINANERKEFLSVLSKLGKSTLDFENENLEKAIEEFESKEKDSEKIYKTKGDLALKMGFLVGLAVFILLV